MSKPRREICADFADHCVELDDGVSFRTDDALERLWLRWNAGGRGPGRAGIDSEADTSERLWFRPAESASAPRYVVITGLL